MMQANTRLQNRMVFHAEGLTKTYQMGVVQVHALPRHKERNISDFRGDQMLLFSERLSKSHKQVVCMRICMKPHCSATLGKHY